MKINFHIHYNTYWGQRIGVVGDHSLLGNGRHSSAFILTYKAEGVWEGSLDLGEDCQQLDYQYVLLGEERQLLEVEWGAARVIDLSNETLDCLYLKDSWRSNSAVENACYNAAFLHVIFQQEVFKAKRKKRTERSALLRLNIRAVEVPQGMQLCVLGDTETFGNWDFSKPLLLSNANFPIWSVEVPLPSPQLMSYKYGLYDPTAKRVVALEEGEDRSIQVPLNLSGQAILNVCDEYARLSKEPWKGAGVALPVFSLRSETGFGVGEFSDIKILVDWAAQVQMQMIQILPINDTTATYTWVDSYPYAAISVFALHPMYLRLEEISGFSEAVDLTVYAKERELLNAKPVVDYEEVIRLKLQYARQIFDLEKDRFFKATAFKRYFKQNKHWLAPYALFCYFRDHYKTADFSQWGKDRVFTTAALKKNTSSRVAHYDEIAFQYFLQFHLDQQLKAATAYGREKGVVLKGDIPIGIYRNSVDAWTSPHLYNMDGQAGAPPDPFSATGQNWGFPTYNWAEIAKDGYQWWQNRLRQLSDYFDAFRIDHILGFFRIWEIPLEQVEGTMGYFNPAIPIELQEFADRGIPFDEDRFCRPFITDILLAETFGDAAQQIKDTFLEGTIGGRYQFKPAFDTQRKIRAYLQLAENKIYQEWEKGLFDLMGNVLFFVEKGKTGLSFHPRIESQKLSSFQALPYDVQDKVRDLYNNYFYHRQEDFWRKQAMTKLPAIKAATNMLICGEDLGMVPACVPGVMKALDFFSLEIQRMSKNPASEFLQEEDIPYFSVCSPSTHDMSPLRAWWEESDRGQIQRFYQQELQKKGEAPYFCEPYVAQAIFQQHLSWPSMWAVFPMQDILAIDPVLRRTNPFEERINEPSNPQHYWRYRLHIPLEELLKEEAFNQKIRDLLLVAGRT